MGRTYTLNLHLFSAENAGQNGQHFQQRIDTGQHFQQRIDKTLNLFIYEADAPLQLSWQINTKPLSLHIIFFPATLLALSNKALA